MVHLSVNPWFAGVYNRDMSWQTYMKVSTFDAQTIENLGIFFQNLGWDCEASLKINSLNGIEVSRDLEQLESCLKMEKAQVDARARCEEYSVDVVESNLLIDFTKRS